MKDRKKRKQRQEVRKILKAMRGELETQRLTQQQDHTRESTLHLGEIIKRARGSIT